jgi:hypothetical protein
MLVAGVPVTAVRRGFGVPEIPQELRVWRAVR